jgi:hypothetical protein
VALVAPREPTARLPRVTRLLALAHRIDRMIRVGDIRDWAEAARLVGVTRARMTQIANLTLLSPSIQAALLDLEVARGSTDPLTERALRTVVNQPVWDIQHRSQCEILTTLPFDTSAR